MVEGPDFGGGYHSHCPCGGCDDRSNVQAEAVMHMSLHWRTASPLGFQSSFEMMVLLKSGRPQYSSIMEAQMPLEATHCEPLRGVFPRGPIPWYPPTRKSGRRPGDVLSNREQMGRGEGVLPSPLFADLSSNVGAMPRPEEGP